MKYLEKLILSIFILILSSTCVFIVVQMYAASHSTKFDEFVQLYELKEAISQNTKAIQEIQSTLALLKNELMRIAFKPPKHLQKPALQMPVLQAQYVSSHQAQVRQAQISPIMLAQATLPQGNLGDSDSFTFPDKQFPEEQAASEQDNPFMNEKSSEEYWRAIQQAAATRDYLKYNPKSRQKYLENGAKLIQKYEEAITNYLIDAESIQFKEAMMEEEGLKAVESIYSTKKKLAAYVSEAKQLCRELDAMLEEQQTIKLPKATSYIPVSTRGQEQNYQFPRLVDKIVISDGKGNFIIKVGFVYQTESGGIQKSLMNVEDEINLRTMQSINGLYHYPGDFIEEIKNITRKTYRQGFLEFRYANQKRKEYEQHQFISIIN